MCSENKFKKRETPMLVLASASPRRLEICHALGLEPVVLTADCQELEAGCPHEVACKNAESKGLEVQKKAGNEALILGADTIVVKDGRILGKPQNSKEAQAMLELLSDGWHKVYTGMAMLQGQKKPQIAYSVTEVKFAALSREDISWYIKSQEPFDKAGAYGIQGKGGLFIEEIKGDYGTVVGLCPRILVALTKALGYDIKDLIK